MKFTFNTGRAYTLQGQTIHVETTDTQIFFHDESRCIAGYFDYEFLDIEPRTEHYVRGIVMGAYDSNNYREQVGMPAKGEARYTLKKFCDFCCRTMTKAAYEAHIEACSYTER